MNVLYEEYDEPKTEDTWQKAKFDRKREREIVEAWWKWAEKAMILCIEQWDRFVYRHAALCYAIRRLPPPFWNERFQSFSFIPGSVARLPQWNH